MRVGWLVHEVLRTRIVGVPGEPHVDLVGVVRRDYHGDAGAAVCGRAIVEFVDGVVDIAVVMVVVHAGSYAYLVVERTGEYGLIVARGIGAEFDSRFVLPRAGGVLGHV